LLVGQPDFSKNYNNIAPKNEGRTARAELPYYCDIVRLSKN
jgi:hypothetical protein